MRLTEKIDVVSVPVSYGYSIRKYTGPGGGFYYCVMCRCGEPWYSFYEKTCRSCYVEIPEHVRGFLDLCKTDYGAS